MIIYLDPKTYQFLGNYSFKPGNTELELRFGKYKDGKFKPDIGNKIYDEMENYLKNLKDKQIASIQYENSMSVIFSDGIRKVVFPTKTFYQRKDKIYTGDIEYKNFILRLSESNEVELSNYKDISENIVDTRYRNRTIYNHISGAFYYVLTKINTSSSKEITYELEIEYNIKQQTIPFLTRMVQDSINIILPILVSDKDRFSYLPLSEESYIKDQYSYLYIKEPKPVNLSRYITPDLQSLGYSVTNKLDGERFILVFTSFGFYAFNNRKIEKYNSKNYLTQGYSIKSHIVFALDSEFFEGKYYIFDCMVYNGEKIIEKSHEDRIKDAEQIIRCVSQGIPPNFLILKPFYRGDLKKDTEYLLNTLLKDNNDGIIYTSNGPYNSNIYKWKFPEKMSIDFATYKIRNQKYELYVKDKIEDFPVNVLFHGTDIYPLENASYESKEELKNGGIYEFGYDYELNEFKLFRERPDKIDPNFITVAENVWNDIKNPYTSKELISLLSPKVLENYRKYQNNIKRDLIEQYCSNKNILDLGSGRGGDLGKYESIGVNHLWCVEPNEKNYTELLRRLSERKKMKNKTTLIKTVAQDTEEIVKGIRNTLVYDIPVLFSAKIFPNGKIADDINIKPFTVSDFKSLDGLKIVITEILFGEFGITMDKNSFVISDFKGEMLTDDSLFDLLDDNQNIKLYLRYPLNDLEKQELGGNFQNWFPRIKNEEINYEKLMITKEGVYSLTKYVDSIAIIKAMKNIIGEENMEGLTIMDGTANVGGDSIRFAMNFNNVISVELNKENYDVLVNNIKVYNFSEKIKAINGDVTKVYNDIQLFTDVLYLDPPWGGKGYNEYEDEEMVIFLSNISLTNFIGNVLLSPCKPKYIFIKLPINYNINSLRNMPYVYDMQVYNIRKFYLVCMSVDNEYNPLKKADILTSFFSLSFFFFKDEKGLYSDLDNLVNTIDKTIKDGGYFIGTTIDGEQTKNLLNSSPDKKFDFDGGYIKYEEENPPIIELLIKDTIVETQRESLVDFNLLILKLSEKNIYLEESDIFLPNDKLTEKENILNSLYRYFVFRKASKKQIYEDKANKIIKKNINLDSLSYPLSTEEIINIMSMDYDFQNCQKYLDELLTEKRNIESYHIYNFNYITDPSSIINSHSYKNLINIYKEYINGYLMKEVNGIVNPGGINKNKNYTLFNFKNKYIGNINKIFSYELNVILSCLYQMYNTASILASQNMNLTNPILFLSNNQEIDNILIEEPLNLKVLKGMIVNVLNYSYTSDIKDKTINTNFPFNGNFDSYQLIEILQCFPDSYKKNIYYSLIKGEYSEFNDFLIRFIDIKKKYLDFSQYHRVHIFGGIMDGYNDISNIKDINNILFLKYSIELLEEKLDNMDKDDYDYFDQLVFELNKTELKEKKKISNKVYKWLEVLSIGLNPYSKDITVFSNGYIPNTFLYAMKSYLKHDNFKWYTNSNTSIDTKCKNSFNIDTLDLDNINYIEDKMNKKIDIYASYTNKDNYNTKRFLGDILFGLVTLKEGGTMFFNIKSFFSQLEMSIIGIISDIFNDVSIIKPYFSKLTESEVYIICENYKRNDSYIKVLKEILKEENNSYYYIPNSLDVKKYSQLLLAFYTFYGRQEFFMKKDIELFNKLKSKGVKYEDIQLNKLKNSNDKFISYYVRKRLDYINEKKKIKDIFNIKKWDNYGCKKRKEITDIKHIKEIENKYEEEDLKTIIFDIHPSLEGIHQPYVFNNIEIKGVYNINGNFYVQKNRLYDVYKLIDKKFKEDIILHNYDKCCKGKHPPVYNKLTRLSQKDIDNNKELNIVIVPKSSETPCPIKCPDDKEDCNYFKLKNPIKYYKPSNISITFENYLSDKEYIYYKNESNKFVHPANPSKIFSIMSIYDDSNKKWKDIMLEKGWETQSEFLKPEPIKSGNIKVIGTVFTKKGVYGDFEWQINSGKYENALFLFNDDENKNHHKKAGTGNAVIRKYNKYSIPDKPRSVGIVTGKDGKGYERLTPEVKKAIDKTIKDAKDIIKKYGYKEVYYSAKTPNGILGKSRFEVSDIVLHYITNKIKSLGEEISWGSLEELDQSEIFEDNF
jgi:predicted RNA methylase